MEVNDLAFIKFHDVQMTFYPDAWITAPEIDLIWIDVDFPPNPRAVIPKKSGVYAFIVEPGIFSLLPANGVFYVGKATNLYQRIGAYMSEINKESEASARPYVWRMLNQWNGYLRYYYSTTTDVAHAENIEAEMLKALRPPFNRQLDAETSQVTRAFQ